MYVQKSISALDIDLFQVIIEILQMKYIIINHIIICFFYSFILQSKRGCSLSATTRQASADS